MYLRTVHIKNFRLLKDICINLDLDTTVIVGRNNSGKTSIMDFLTGVIQGSRLLFHDYPISCREHLYQTIKEFLDGNIDYCELVEKIIQPSIEFLVGYELEDAEQPLGALAPFIIDTDVEINNCIILAEYKFSIPKDQLKNLFAAEHNSDADITVYSLELVKKTVRKNFDGCFHLTIEAINPKDKKHRQLKSHNELSALFPVHIIRAERGMDESDNGSKNPLSPVLTRLFKTDIKETNPEIKIEVQKLRNIIDQTNEEIGIKTNTILEAIVRKSIDFGYPSLDEMQFKAITEYAIEDQIKGNTDLAYIEYGQGEELPSTYNGLGYKNLIKIELELVEYSKQIASIIETAIPLVFLEEPESHMHPQLQQAFVKFLRTFLNRISERKIQVILTTHSSHISNTIPFSQIRYAQKSKNQITYKDLSEFCTKDPTNSDFIHKYLTLSRCDLFFADKAILIEGTAERLLIPDMIKKCGDASLFKSTAPQLPSQYYSIIEVGGAYAHLFCPFLEFLQIPTLIITDIDSVDDKRARVYVSEGTNCSNATILWWVRRALSLTDKDSISLKQVINLSSEQKTYGLCHIEYQTNERGLCGRSLEESIINVNRDLYDIRESPTEDCIDFKNKKKTDFALELLLEKPTYKVPAYIQSGLCWLDEQRL